MNKKESNLNFKKERWLNSFKEVLEATDDVIRGGLAILWMKSADFPRKKKKRVRKDIEKQWNELNQLSF